MKERLVKNLIISLLIFVFKLKIPNNHNCDMDFQKTDDPVLSAINKYRYHSSIVIINNKIEPEDIFLLKLYKMIMFS